MFVAIFLFIFFVEFGVDTSTHLNDGFMVCWQRSWQGNSGTFFKICDSALAIIICLCKWIKRLSALQKSILRLGVKGKRRNKKEIGRVKLNFKFKFA